MLPQETAKLLVSSAIDVMAKKGFTRYDTPYKLNVLGLRNQTRRCDQFDDIELVWRTIIVDGKPVREDYAFQMTTDPGEYYLLSPMRKAGTAILCPDVQIINSHKLMDNGHKDIRAYRQVKAFPHIRDNDRNTILNFDLFADKTKWNTTEIISANLHPASKNYILRKIGKYSAACQVTQDHKDFDKFVELGNEMIARNNDPYVSYGILWLKEVAPHLAANV